VRTGARAKAGDRAKAGGTVKAGGRAKKTSVALLAASMVLAACGGGAKPDPSSSRTTGSPPTTTATAPTVSVSSTTAPTIDPNIPAAARAHTPAGAEAFVKYFFERLNAAWTAPHAGILSPLCQASSKACAAYEKTAARLASTGHHYDGNPLTVAFIGPLGSASASHINILANVVQERRSEVDAAGKTYVTDQRKDLRLDFELLQTGQAWSVASIKIMK
jgi:hypothetical protein